MSFKINQSTLLSDGFNKGFTWTDRYSSNDKSDSNGRWARIGYYNGFMISWIIGYVTVEGKIANTKEIGVCSFFSAHLMFPCSSNQGGESKEFNSLSEAKKYSEEMFNDFKKLINI